MSGADGFAGATQAEPLAAAAAALLLAVAGEWLHSRRVRVVAGLAFGPARRPAPWARAAPALRSVGWAALAWSLTLLLLLPPARHSIDPETQREREPEHVVVVLDVSPSMRLEDAGPGGDRSRTARARELMESFFSRIPLERYRVSVVATYNGALPVVEDTADFDVVRNILGDLPMHYAFRSGPTRLFDGLAEAARIAKPWPPRSATLVLVSDGDTVPAQGMPRMPASVGHVLVVGVGDPRVGRFIDGRQSRQDASTLRQIAVRLGGRYHDGNEKHLPGQVVAAIAAGGEEGVLERLTLREYALATCASSAALLALLPWLLRCFGTAWVPGVPPARATIATLPAVAPRSRALVPAGSMEKEES